MKVKRPDTKIYRMELFFLVRESARDEYIAEEICEHQGEVVDRQVEHMHFTYLARNGRYKVQIYAAS